MKHFTFLTALLLLCTVAISQNAPNLQAKIKKMQEANERYSPMTKSLLINSANSQGNMQFALKSAQEMQTLDSVIYQTLIDETDTWMNEEKDSYQYDSELTNTSILTQTWNQEGNNWSDDNRVDFEFNDINQIVVVKDYNINENSGELEHTNSINVTYDDEGRISILEHLEANEEDVWAPVFKQVFHYSTGEQVTKMDIISWSEDEGVEVVDTSYYIYEYDTEGKLESSSLIIEIEDSEVTIQESRYSYDDAGRRSSMEFSSLDFLEMTLTNNFRMDYEYDESGDMLTEIYSEWNNEQEEWVQHEKDEYIYNDINFADVIFPSFLELGIINAEINPLSNTVSEIHTYSMENGDWELTDKSIFYYSEGTPTDAPYINDVKLTVYPNPVSDVVTFNFKGHNNLSLEIFTIAGAKIIDRNINSGQKVALSKLNKGIYLYKLKNQGLTIHSGKLVKN